MKTRIALMLSVALVLLMGACRSGGDKEEDPKAKQLAIAKAVAPALVRVEYSLKYDKGESPECGGYHGFSEEGLLREERPLEAAGFLLSPSLVITGDLMIHPRFVESVAVRYGDKVVQAKLHGVAKDQGAVFLELAEPLEGTRALDFSVESKAPFYVVTHGREDSLWTINVAGLGGQVSVRQDGEELMSSPRECLIVDEDARPVGMNMKDELPVDDSWKGSPLQWDIISAEKMAELLGMAEKALNAGILRVQLSFRSPKKGESGGGGFGSYSMYGSDDDGDKTERNVLGLLLDADRVVVLSSLKPKVTARLERITVHTANGREVKANFESTLSDYGCLLARLEEPLDGVLVKSVEPIEDYRDKVLLAADVRLQGETRSDYFSHKRIFDFRIGWRSNVYPGMSAPEATLFLFDTAGALVAFPLAHREKASTERGWYGDRPIMSSVVSFDKVFTDLAENIDLSNVPLTEEQENRLAWLGVELQPLNKELARANKVSEFSSDGQIGALVSYVYPDSPAQRAGIDVGYILLRLHVEDYPKPLEVELSDGYGFGREFPWEYFDELPEEYFDQLPRPWPGAENSLTRAISDLGFGKKFVAEFFNDGKIINKDFVVTESPAHYDSAKKYKSEVLGLTVKNLTYEVRRYFHEKPGDPGVIISKIEPGSKASVSGIKPYELLTQVNDEPVNNVDDFEKLVAGQEQLRLVVKRMTKGRVVRITLPAASTQGD